MKLICEHRSECSNPSCRHYTEHEEESVISDCTPGPCSYAHKKIKCISIEKDWDE